MTHKIHSLTSRSFTKINLLGGPFNVKLYRNINSNDNYTSVDVETEQSIHKLISIDIEQNDILTIRRIKLCGQVNNEATLKSLGVGAVECRDLLTQKINLISSSIGTIYITVIDEINITLSGIATVYYSGP
ncbi:unnamed protein product [Rotaria sp. Silwood1]|nr:unnamed protein product [Rotaria sp. Silwood1]CAF0855483.1 unnamed protein product [Rotaria sp. Silwood1]CAF3377607.1 unnamed protein product [Rotaria sp. Silwood1]CAF4949211.1 unnamed protein product [Rotaria sp. Silwood1]